MKSVMTVGAAWMMLGYVSLALSLASANDDASHSHVLSNKDIQMMLEEQKSVFENKTVSVNALFISPQNEFTEGRVQQHVIKNTSFNAAPIFIIGNDKRSIAWAIANAGYLKSIHALGIMAHSYSRSEIEAIEGKTGLHFFTAAINGLSNVIGTTHYPVLIDHQWVLQ
jgi:integrating conjugative element protein (TIGR03765 family)